jgi:hypothetical protein
MSRALTKAKQFAASRTAFGHPLHSNALHLHTLLQLEACYRASLYLTLDVAQLLGETEQPEKNRETGRLAGALALGLGLDLDRAATKKIVRQQMPMIKLFTAKHAVQVASEALECLGGVGYLEPSGMPQILRDAQVLPVWEGTSNVCSLDILRALGKNADALHRFFTASIRGTPVEQELAQNWGQLRACLADAAKYPAAGQPWPYTREFGYSVSRCFAGAALARHFKRQPSPANRLILDTFMSLEDCRGPVISRKLNGQGPAPFDVPLAQRVLFGREMRVASSRL